MNEAALHRLSPHVIEAARTITRNTGTPVQSIDVKPQPAQPVAPSLRPVCEQNCLLGEAPIWDANHRTLYWIDIFGPHIHALDTATNAHRMAGCSDLPGAIALNADGDLVVAQKDGVFRLDPETLRPLEQLFDFGTALQGKRINDGALDSAGKLLLGVMDMGVEDDAGEVLVLSPDMSSAATAVSGLTLPNGLRWSPDGRSLYVVDSRRQTVFRAAYDLATGVIGPKETLIRIPPEIGMPDGIAVDTEGCIWVALWDGWSIARFDPNGHLLEKIVLSVPRPTSLCFGGPDMKTLFITSASVRLSSAQIQSAPLSGSTLALTA